MSHLNFDGVVNRWGAVWPEVPEPQLAVKPGRDYGLARLFDYLAEVEWRIKGQEGGAPKGFTIPRASMFVEQPEREQDLQFPALAVLPSKTEEDAWWLGASEYLEDTFGLYGPGTVLNHYGELTEEVTLDLWCQFAAQRRAIIAGLEGSVLHAGEGSFALTVPDYYNQIMVVEYGGSTRIDGPLASRGMREAHIHLTLRLPAVFLVRATTLTANALVDVEE